MKPYVNRISWRTGVSQRAVQFVMLQLIDGILSVGMDISDLGSDKNFLSGKIYQSLGKILVQRNHATALSIAVTFLNICSVEQTIYFINCNPRDGGCRRVQYIFDSC